MTHEELYELRHGHELNYIQCQSSTAHTFGNVTAFIQNWIINLFPEKMFKTIHVNSKIAHQQMRSTPHEFLKKTPPMFIIRPRVEWKSADRFLNGTMLIDRQGDLYHRYGGGNLEEFFQDNKRKVSVKFQLNRHVMNFDVVLIFNTLIQQINWSNYLLNAVRVDIPFFLDTCLESYLSPELLQQLSICSGIPLKDEEGNTAEFMRYMNQNSKFPITYKLQGSSGTEEFYRYYPVKIDTIISNFSTDEGEKVGHVMDRYQIQFTVRCEFYGTGFYFLFSDKLKKNSILVSEDPATIIPMFTDVLTRDDVDLPVGWKLYASPSCRLEDRNDDVDISSVLNDSIKAAIKFHLDRGITLAEFFRIRVREQGRLLQYGKDYDFDPYTYKVRFRGCSTYYTYKIILLLNIEYVNNLVKEVYRLK